MKYKNKYVACNSKYLNLFSRSSASQINKSRNGTEIENDGPNILNTNNKLYKRIEELKKNNVLYGGSNVNLSGDVRASYIDRCEKMYCGKLSDEECYNIVQKNIIDLYMVAIKVLESYNKSQTEDLYLDMSEKLNNIMSVDISKPDIPMLNIISLQCVILFTEILRKIYPTKAITHDPEITAKYALNLYIELTRENKWDSYHYIYESIDNIQFIANPFTTTDKIKSAFSRLIYDKNHKKINCNNLKNNILLVILGEFKLYEILVSLMNDIYLVGITTNMSWADGYYRTPFEFMCHDMIHASARETGYDNTNLIYSKSFIEYIYINKDKFGQDMFDRDIFDQIVIILFIIMHENSEAFNILNEKQIDIGSIFYNLYVRIEDDPKYNWRWTDINYYGGLLPPDILINKYYEKNSIGNYLHDAATRFTLTWNKFFKTYTN